MCKFISTQSFFFLAKKRACVWAWWIFFSLRCRSSSEGKWCERVRDMKWMSVRLSSHLCDVFTNYEFKWAHFDHLENNKNKKVACRVFIFHQSLSLSLSPYCTAFYLINIKNSFPIFLTTSWHSSWMLKILHTWMSNEK